MEADWQRWDASAAESVDGFGRVVEAFPPQRPYAIFAGSIYATPRLAPAAVLSALVKKLDRPGP